MPLSPGTTLGPYEVTAKIAKAAWARCIERETPSSIVMWR